MSVVVPEWRLTGNFIGTCADVRCPAVTLFLDGESELADGVVRAVLFDLTSGPLLVDPRHLDGIRIGGAADARALRVECPGVRTGGVRVP
ncbi:hypothetical protein [Catenuloplanes indicus]|uniref:Uncharacterized protein n=1 Tax=Catenuloplanes indicus TaxID=137267 RepID=A0AAE3VU88_9ACTN|nr:hypothetical protein [Catenuloplanes indicus]MDQ0363434.1 hypothetical protein [Catenuloplanes indicus]